MPNVLNVIAVPLFHFGCLYYECRLLFSMRRADSDDGAALGPLLFQQRAINFGAVCADMRV